jgi:ferredoxin, 2Fe-2S
MPHIIYHHADGGVDDIEIESGTSVMRAAVSNGVRGIVGECGGVLMCSTCHVYVRDPGQTSLPEISDDEEEMLECTASPRDARRSRLGCQLKAGDHFDMLAVDVPETQY